MARATTVKRLMNKRITNGKNVWTVTGRFLSDNSFVATTIHGDITDVHGIKEALEPHRP